MTELQMSYEKTKFITKVSDIGKRENQQSYELQELGERTEENGS